jgi:sec-independent protein translocase protein TatB
MFPEGRMLDFLIVGVVALIVVGPKDLPILMRRVGQFVGKMRSMANEFRASFDELARQSELEELRKEVEAMRVSHQTTIAQINPLNDASGVFDDINQHMSAPLGSAAELPVFASPEAAPAPVAHAKPKAPRAPRAKAAKSAAPAKPAASAAPTKPKASPKTAKPSPVAAKTGPKPKAPRKTAAAQSDAS